MNRQNKNGGRGIEWTEYTWNVVRGCPHACRWTMPDGSVAKCYAEVVAETVAMEAYPEGFNHHYFVPKALEQPGRIKNPAKIFIDSMSDLMAAWVTAEQIQAVLDVCAANPRHTFQLLTKNAPRLRRFWFPANVWVGVSAPPTEFKGHTLNLEQQIAYVVRALNVLEDLKVNKQATITWMSMEPLSFDIAEALIEWYGDSDLMIDDTVDLPLDWVVIGAASNGRTIYQPKPEWVQHLVGDGSEGSKGMLEGIPVFCKGNLDPKLMPAWREEFPVTQPVQHGLL